MTKKAGRIVKAISGFFYVYTVEGSLLQCRARGVFKKRGIKPIVGDFVKVEPQGLYEGIVDEIEPRRNALVRPAIANVDQVLLVISLVDPPLSLYQLDKLLAMVARESLPALIAFTKIDLAGAEAVMQGAFAVYTAIGYPTLALQIREGLGRDTLELWLAEKITVMAGLSGVGKSTILRTLIPTSDAITGAISERGHRGRHTTTHVELFPFAGGFLADTPGFSQIDLVELDLSELDQLFIEIGTLSRQCDFRGCLHETEMGCAVRRGCEEGTVAATRYAHYLQMLAELKEAKARRY